MSDFDIANQSFLEVSDLDPYWFFIPERLIVSEDV